MTVYFGSRPVIILNTHDVIKDALGKRATEFAGRPQDLFWVTDISRGRGKSSAATVTTQNASELGSEPHPDV